MNLIGKPGEKNLKKEGRAMKRLLISFVLAVALLVVPIAGALAAEDTVTVTATPGFVAISNLPDTWAINNVGGGNGAIEPGTIYYSNPLGDETAPSSTVVDGDCYFEITNTSTVPTNIKVDIGAFTLGDANMTNSDLGSASNDATTFGASVWYSGLTYTSKVISKSTGSDNLYTGLGATTDLKWGMEILTRTDAFTGVTSSDATITITATAA